MAKFEYTHEGHVYTVEADDEKLADKKFDETLKLLQKNEEGDKLRKETQENKAWDDKFAAAKTPYEKFDTGMNAVFGRANREIRKIPGLDFTEKFLGASAIKGVPIARHYVPQTEYLTEQEKEHPWISKGMQVAGGTAATLPLVGAAAVNAARAGSGVIPQFLGQTAVNTALNSGDTLAEKGLNMTKGDMGKDLAWGVGQSIIPTAFTKTVGQSVRMPNRTSQEFVDFMRPGGEVLRGAPRPAQAWSAKPQPWPDRPFGHFLPNGQRISVPTTRASGTPIQTPIHGTAEGLSPEALDILSSLGGGFAGYGVYGLPGAAVGGGTGHFLSSTLYNLMHSAPGEVVGRVARHPSTQDILRALSAQGKTHMTPPSTTLGE